MAELPPVVDIFSDLDLILRSTERPCRRKDRWTDRNVVFLCLLFLLRSSTGFTPIRDTCVCDRLLNPPPLGQPHSVFGGFLCLIQINLFGVWSELIHVQNTFWTDWRKSIQVCMHKQLLRRKSYSSVCKQIDESSSVLRQIDKRSSSLFKCSRIWFSFYCRLLLLILFFTSRCLFNGVRCVFILFISSFLLLSVLLVFCWFCFYVASFNGMWQ